MIVDTRTRKPIFYKRSFLSEKDPLDRAILNKQLTKIFKGYFDKDQARLVE